MEVVVSALVVSAGVSVLSDVVRLDPEEEGASVVASDPLAHEVFCRCHQAGDS